jgi:hypothetical protein
MISPISTARHLTLNVPDVLTLNVPDVTVTPHLLSTPAEGLQASSLQSEAQRADGIIMRDGGIWRPGW